MNNIRGLILGVTVILILANLTAIPHPIAQKISEKTIQNNTSLCDCSCSSYIIKFKEKPLSAFVSETLNKNIGFLAKSPRDFYTQKIENYKQRLLSDHESAKKEILKLVETDDADVVFSFDFVNIFNGVVIKKISSSVLEKIRKLSFVESVYPDYKVFVSLNDSVPLINADDVWKLKDSYGRNVTGDGVSVAILDTGIDYNHPALGGGFGPGYKVVGGWDFVTCSRYIGDDCAETKPEDDDPIDDNGHGTHCAGIVLGVAPNASLYAYKVLNSYGEGAVSWVIKALEKCVDPNGDDDFSDHIDIISMSFGSSEPGNPDNPLNIAIDNSVRAGVVVVVAAGNLGYNGYGTISTPGCARKAITVGSSDKNDQMAGSSSKGPTSIGMLKPDAVAPGVNIRSTWLNGEYRYKSGTSMACPHVSGTAALILQMHPNWTPDEVKMALRNTAVDLGYDIRVQGYGRIDAYKAVTLEEAPPVAVLNTSGVFNQTVIKINGTATADNFEKYTIFYSYMENWVKLFESDNEVVDNLLFEWDTKNVVHGRTYEIKLEVKGNNQTSSDIVFITLEGDTNQTLFIEAPYMVNETDYFTVNISDAEGKPVKTLIIFYISKHIPRIKYGSSVVFKAPRIFNPFKENIKGGILAIRLSDLNRINTSIIIKNSKNIFN